MNKVKEGFIKIKDKYKNFEGIGIFGRIVFITLIILLIVIIAFRVNGTEFEIKIGEIKEFFIDKSIPDTARINTITINFLLLLSLVLVFYAVFGSFKVGLIILIILMFALHFVNLNVMNLRGTAFTFSDIFSVGTALAVSEGMKLLINKEIIEYFVINVLLVLLIIFIKFKKYNTLKSKIISRVVCLVLGILFFVIVISTERFKNMNYWDLERYYRHLGVPIVFAKEIDEFTIEKPEGYSVEKAIEILDKYKKIEEDNKKENKKEAEEKPNIIVVMNESFSDLNTVYELGFRDNIPYYHSIEDDAIKGTLYSSVFGGGTASAEWELLTGNTGLFKPEGAIPYILYIKKNTNSIIRDFNEAGYYTLGMHTYYGKCYNRKAVYNYLGFDKAIFKEDIEDKLNYIKSDHPDDLSTYKALLEEYDNRDKNKNFFGFVLTMQNHTPFDFAEYQNKGYDEYFTETDQLLSLINDSDEALKYLIDELSAKDEKIVLVFLGDHQPKLVADWDGKGKFMYAQKVPYVIWTNYDIEEKKEDTSTNFISTYIYDMAGIEGDYNNFLKCLKSEIPVFCAKGYIDKNGKEYTFEEESPYQELIDEYRILEYYYMFDYNKK